MDVNIGMTGSEEDLEKCMEELKNTVKELTKTYPVDVVKEKYKIYKANLKSVKNFSRRKNG